MIWRPTVFMREVTSGAANPAGLAGVSVQPAAAEKGLTEPQKRTPHICESQVLPELGR